ncbi:PIN2/TERF1-interacting telomerase inhibitor 1 isoform X2 [Castor canadensis]|uniref:PIN2/TERF1-interacting telomerase inhibitor 1 isoform X2 n=1 Tax=Castor canadensis TaxID=51338 RepID=A0A8B7WAU0_CASCN|nr:PIN2/TERF1-interacting telomerase inhibitor 1 isoform X2 [Castor canadensis]
MSMLAERRRKQKWAVDPRNTAWSNDDSKFGQRMLEKMGWSKGKDNWIAHQDDFNQLLAELNTCHGPETADSPDNKEKKTFSLEEKSKFSKNRVHYMKFTKGKDLSSRSKTDLDCIFGKRQSKKTAKEDCGPAAADGNEPSTTTTSSFTIQEYFAKRMAQLKNKPQAQAPGPGLSEPPVEGKREKKNTKEATGKDVENLPKPKAKQPKKKKREEEESQEPVAKRKDQAEKQPGESYGDKCPSASPETAGDYMQPCDDQDGAQKPKKKKAKKKQQKLVEVAVDAVLDEAPGKKKKKKASR